MNTSKKTEARKRAFNSFTKLSNLKKFNIRPDAMDYGLGFHVGFSFKYNGTEYRLVKDLSQCGIAEAFADIGKFIDSKLN